MPVTIGDIYNRINEIAPFELCEEWDNVGILAGSKENPVERVLLALDLNSAVLAEAIEKKVQLIVTHHPILFRGRKNLREDDPEGRLLCGLIRNNIGLIAAHTNFDNAVPGVNDALAAKLGLTDIAVYEHGLRCGRPQQATLGQFRAHVESVLGGPVRCYGREDAPIHCVGLLGGAGGDFAMEALMAGADVYLTGEISHHRAWDAYEAGLCILEAGHAATEIPAISTLLEGLQIGANGVQWSVEVFASEAELFR